MQKQLEQYQVEQLAPVSLQSGATVALTYYFFKRLFDILFACTILILLAPIYALFAALVMLDSPGPPFFVQERVGGRWLWQNGRIVWHRKLFRCYKYRTMLAKCDPELHKQYIEALIQNDHERMSQIQGEDSRVRKLVHDPRITRLGRILRKISLDELPQFLNVLKGEMSVVGPRPAIPYEVEMYKPWQLERFNTKPGITGLCQVTARCSADFDEMIRMDLEYIRKQSFWLDLIIILKTPLVVFSCRGAY